MLFLFVMQYLGDLEREGGPSGFHLDNESTTLPLLPMSVGGTIIFPGETLPINTIDITVSTKLVAMTTTMMVCCKSICLF